VSTPQRANRSAGILLHPTSLPGPFGIGDLGPVAYSWVDALARAGQKWWQVLPLGPTGYGDSPYQSPSAFGGNTNLLSPELLQRDGLADQNDLDGVHFPDEHVEYPHVTQFKNHLLGLAWHHFQSGRGAALRPEFDEFCRQQATWLEPFAVFSALSEEQGGKSWQEWPAALVRREPAALKKARERLADALGRHRFGQFLFTRQWKALKAHANGKGVRLIGDVPIFVASHSADVWSNPDLFFLDDKRRPTVVAGVPPDYFSATGQLWGNPLYRWDDSKRTGHAWWIARLRAALEQVDLVRIDHFRGFESYWEIPAGSPTAQGGHWVKGPGAEFFDVVQAALGGLPLLAEDLGLLTPEVGELRDRVGLPGMRVLQFAFGDRPDNLYLPHNFVHNTVVYTGTHDNDTSAGWYKNAQDHERRTLHRYAPAVGQDVPREMMRLAWSSVADFAIAPLQDLLRLGSEARMNMPGQAQGNWQWRLRNDQLGDGDLAWLADLTELYRR
jgi:4-alpha-glucanotransferase